MPGSVVSIGNWAAYDVLFGGARTLGRCTNIVTGSDSPGVSRSKPFKYAYEKEIVMYAYLNKLDYFSTECTYAPQAYRGTPTAAAEKSIVVP